MKGNKDITVFRSPELGILAKGLPYRTDLFFSDNKSRAVSTK